MRIFWCLALFFTTLLSFGQTQFEKGYFILNNGDSLNCYIKNTDWKYNPDKFKYKFSADDEIRTHGLEDISAFGVEKKFRYEKHLVSIDISDDRTNLLTYDKNPKLEFQTLFLNVLIQGDVTLYEFKKGNTVRFFYRINQEVPTQFIYKRYFVDTEEGVKIAENYFFHQQIYNDLSSEDISEKMIRNTDYNEKDLIKICNLYNKQGNNNIIRRRSSGKTEKFFHLNIKPGAKLTSLTFEDLFNDDPHIEFDKKILLTFGIEAEYILPFNNSKWSVFKEPTYQNYQNSVQANYFETKNGPQYTLLHINYSSIEIPIGVRYYAYLSDTSKLFWNTSLAFPDISMRNAKI
ncbi:hypothetical protein [Robertkochia solimangrovi]|uniref:hypothetical protein n=1 Tax=Robertkochia solimangrovi TaxID=2213046 RepID=UPI0013A542DA|nr:hypothetical protein [Robertkochia solimangrovi]